MALNQQEKLTVAGVLAVIGLVGTPAWWSVDKKTLEGAIQDEQSRMYMIGNVKAQVLREQTLVSDGKPQKVEVGSLSDLEIGCANVELVLDGGKKVEGQYRANSKISIFVRKEGVSEEIPENKIKEAYVRAGIDRKVFEKNGIARGDRAVMHVLFPLDDESGKSKVYELDVRIDEIGEQGLAIVQSSSPDYYPAVVTNAIFIPYSSIVTAKIQLNAPVRIGDEIEFKYPGREPITYRGVVKGIDKNDSGQTILLLDNNGKTEEHETFRMQILSIKGITVEEAREREAAGLDIVKAAEFGDEVRFVGWKNSGRKRLLEELRVESRRAQAELKRNRLRDNRKTERVKNMQARMRR